MINKMEQALKQKLDKTLKIDNTIESKASGLINKV